MLIVHVAFECLPIYKTGGLADVVSSLPKALTKLGVNSTVVMPKYKWIKPIRKLPGSKVPVLYIDGPYFTDKLKHHPPRLQARAFADFCMKTLQELKKARIKPDIIHVHDWHAALIPLLLQKQPDPYFAHTKTVLTLHNISFQGEFPARFLRDTEMESILAIFEAHTKQISYLKAGIGAADFITTVSPNHAREIKSGKASFGLKQEILAKKSKFTGILNGIDQTVWDPAKDKLIKEQYDQRSVILAKKKNKTYLQGQLGMHVNEEIPLCGFIARLTKQKGLNLLIPFIESIQRQRIQVVILGAGHKKYEKQLLDFKKTIDPQWYSVNIRYDEVLAHEIYAGSDFFLVPSLYEPCGLTQMIAMVYGSIPIVTPVGGLQDTVEPRKTGFVTKDLTQSALTATIDEAIDLWEEPEKHSKLVSVIMKQDFSWKTSAEEYKRLYLKTLRI